MSEGADMLHVLNVTADSALGTARFACDLGACKGACCTMKGGRGAPLADDEAPLTEAAIAVALPYLSERNREAIEKYGAVEGSKGDYATRCIDQRDCVFVFYEGQVAKCAIERAYFDGKTEFRKPLSCHLFPIRVEEFFGGVHLDYERIAECRSGETNGRTLDMPIIRFLKDPIIRAFGPEFYQALEKEIK